MMHSKREGDIIVAKLDDGEDVIKALERLVAEHELDSALILSGIGMLRELEIGFFNGEAYEKKRFDVPMELTAMSGSISTQPSLIMHIHVNVAGPDHAVQGGHFFGGTVNVTNELVLYVLSDIHLIRKLDQETGQGRRPSSAIVGSDVQSASNSDLVEVALADALTRAVEAQEWDAVAVVTRELQARREALADVLDLGAERKRRGR